MPKLSLIDFLPSFLLVVVNTAIGITGVVLIDLDDTNGKFYAGIAIVAASIVIAHINGRFVGGLILESLGIDPKQARIETDPRKRALFNELDLLIPIYLAEVWTAILVGSILISKSDRPNFQLGLILIVGAAIIGIPFFLWRLATDYQELHRLHNNGSEYPHKGCFSRLFCCAGQKRPPPTPPSLMDRL